MSCAICGKPSSHTHHLVYGFGLRKLCDEDKLTMRLCNDCHEVIHKNGTAGQLSKMLGQALYEKQVIKEALQSYTEEDAGVYARSVFRKRYGRSWL